MKAIIIAGGRGERLKPITNTIPKPMIDIDGKPILLHIINDLKKNGIKDFIIALCFLPEVITKFFGDGSKFGVNIKYTYEDPQNPLGTAGAILLAKSFINKTFIVTYADILRELDIKQMIDFHKLNKAFATLNVYKRPSMGAKSQVLTKNNKVIKFTERPKLPDKQKSLWSNGSFYIFEPEIFNYIPANQKVDFGFDIFPKLSTDKNIFAYRTTSYFVDIGNLEKLEFAKESFPKRKSVLISAR